MLLRRLTVALLLGGVSPVVWGANPSQITATPATVTFRSTDPDIGPAGMPATVTWRVFLGSGTWNITVRANSPTLGNCPGVPASAIQARCTSISVTGWPSGSGACAQPFPLGTGDQQIGGGAQGGILANSTVNITYAFTDSWKYRGAIAPTCSLTLTYTVNVQ